MRMKTIKTRTPRRASVARLRSAMAIKYGLSELQAHLSKTSPVFDMQGGIFIICVLEAGEGRNEMNDGIFPGGGDCNFLKKKFFQSLTRFSAGTADKGAV